MGSNGRYLLLWAKHLMPTNTQEIKVLQWHKCIHFLLFLQISNSSCDVTLSERLLFIKSGDSYEWMTYPAGSGYVETLQCMLVDTWYTFKIFNIISTCDTSSTLDSQSVRFILASCRKEFHITETSYVTKGESSICTQCVSEIFQQLFTRSIMMRLLRTLPLDAS